MNLNSTANPWSTAADRLNRDARIDRSLAAKLKDLSVIQAKSDKLAFALEAGRIYGLRQMFYDHTLRKQLRRDRIPLQPHW